MNYGEMKELTAQRLEEVLAGPVFFEEDEIGESLNDGLEEMADETEYYQTSTDIVVPANTLYAWLGHSSLNVLTLKRVWSPDSSWWLDWTNVEILDRTTPFWQTAGGAPREVFVRGLNYMGIVPIPQQDWDLTLYHTAMPPKMTSDSDTPGMPQEYHFGIVEYAVYDLLCQEAELKRAMSKWQEFGEVQQALKSAAGRKMPDLRMGFSRVSNPR